MKSLHKLHILTKVKTALAKRLDIKLSILQSELRTYECSSSRALVFYIIKKATNASHIKIGQSFGRDASTVLLAVKQLQKKIDDGDLMLSIAVHYLIAETKAIQQASQLPMKQQNYSDSLEPECLPSASASVYSTDQLGS